jgi:hypothetical protein
VSRHPGTTALLRWFEFEHLPPHLRVVSAEFYALAHWLADKLPDSPELTTGLRKLLEAKDCAVRATIDAGGIEGDDAGPERAGE